MTARQWMRIAALASALGLTGTAVAHDTTPATGTDDRSVAGFGMDTPSSGAIVTPEDKALGMGRHGEQARNRNGERNDDTSSPDDDTTDARSSVAPGRSNDERSWVNPGPSNDDASSVRPPETDRSMTDPTSAPGIGRDDASSYDDDNEAYPPGNGSGTQPSDMGQGSMRGQ